MDTLHVEEGKLLLLAQHLERELVEDGEVYDRSFFHGIGEIALMRQSGFA